MKKSLVLLVVLATSVAMHGEDGLEQPVSIADRARLLEKKLLHGEKTERKKSYKLLTERPRKLSKNRFLSIEGDEFDDTKFHRYASRAVSASEGSSSVSSAKTRSGALSKKKQTKKIFADVEDEGLGDDLDDLDDLDDGENEDLDEAEAELEAKLAQTQAENANQSMGGDIRTITQASIDGYKKAGNKILKGLKKAVMFWKW